MVSVFVANKKVPIPMSDIIPSTFLLPVAGRQALNLELSFETQSSTGTFFEALKAIYSMYLE